MSRLYRDEDGLQVLTGRRPTGAVPGRDDGMSAARRGVAARPVAVGPQAARLTPAQVMAMQRLAGNAVVRAIIGPPAVQRCGSTPPSVCPCHQEGAETGSDEVQRQAAGSAQDVSQRDPEDSAAVRLPSRPILSPSDPRMSAILEGVDRPAGPGGVTKPADAACQAAVAEQPPWMPNLRARSPVELGKGTRRQPKLKEPDGPAGAGCRGACGPDCPSTCKTLGTYTEEFRVGGCGYLVEFPNALLCGTHQGCRTHDSCFDSAVANGETQLFGPRHNQCNQDALRTWGPFSTKSWAQGGGPYDNWWYFVDDPVVRRSWRVPSPTSAQPGGVPAPVLHR